MIVAIDGPAGAGKSTVARRLAERLGGGYLNTGAMYRAIALLALREGVALDDGEALASLAREHQVQLTPSSGAAVVTLDGEDVSEQIRAPNIGSAVSIVAGHPQLRRVVVAQQRTIMSVGTWVADGRDIGTVVVPDAEVKIYLTADSDVRARRRHAELAVGGHDIDLDDVLREISSRDERDSGRAESPLRAAEGAHVVDTSGLDVDQVTDLLADIVSRALGGLS